MIRFIISISIVFSIISCGGERPKKQLDSRVGLPASKEDSILINESFYTESELSNTTLEFLRYARNEIYARKGYIFESSCLENYFTHQDWYYANSKDISLDSTDLKWLEIIKNLESEYNKIPPKKILQKFNFDGRPLFYIATDTRKTYTGEIEHSSPYLFLLDSNLIWTLDCDDLPPEYLIKASKVKHYCSDEGIIKSENLRLVNFDSTCINGSSSEIIARLYGPSDDSEHKIYGYDENGEFNLLVHSVFIRNSSKLSDSIIVFDSFDRCDRIGTEFCENEYYFNTLTRRFRKVTPEPYRHSIMTSVMADSTYLFSSPSAAKGKKYDSISFILYKNDKVKISHFKDKDWFYFVEQNNNNGWIDLEGLHDYYVSFAD